MLGDQECASPYRKEIWEKRRTAEAHLEQMRASGQAAPSEDEHVCAISHENTYFQCSANPYPTPSNVQCQALVSDQARPFAFAWPADIHETSPRGGNGSIRVWEQNSIPKWAEFVRAADRGVVVVVHRSDVIWPPPWPRTSLVHVHTLKENTISAADARCLKNIPPPDENNLIIFMAVPFDSQPEPIRRLNVGATCPRINTSRTGSGIRHRGCDVYLDKHSPMMCFWYHAGSGYSERPEADIPWKHANHFGDKRAEWRVSGRFVDDTFRPFRTVDEVAECLAAGFPVDPSCQAKIEEASFVRTLSRRLRALRTSPQQGQEPREEETPAVSAPEWNDTKATFTSFKQLGVNQLPDIASLNLQDILGAKAPCAHDLLRKLREIGVEELSDLALLQPSDADDLGLNRIQMRKILRLVPTSG